jgi:hypothetical protein
MAQKATTKQNMHNFKRLFAAKYHDLKEQRKVNTSQSNFHDANAAVDILHALDNLALAATTDRDIVHQLTQSNQQLTTANKLLTEQLQQALNTNATLLKQLGTKTPAANTTPTNTHQGRQAPFNQAKWESKLDPTGYCWTHGYRVLHGHNSLSCKGKMGGHKDTAT